VQGRTAVTFLGPAAAASSRAGVVSEETTWPSEDEGAAPTSFGTTGAAPEPVPGGGGPFVPGRMISGRYHVIRLLGIGGMGAVYQAWDEKLGIAVALKVILQTRAADDPAATEILELRFKRELLLARRVTHKNVVRIHDLGDVDGTSYITMPYVQGSNLGTVLARDGKLSVERAMLIARQVASGLVAAHEAGVVHRDLKPANIMIEADSDRALIMDFGIARSTAPLPQATRTGAIVGTLEYMAPEQAQGKAVDQRCDIYALGLILYDVLIGGRRGGATAVADLMTRLQEPLPAIRSVNPAVPDAIAAIVDRCVQRDPAERYQTTTELVAALDGVDDQGHARAAMAPQRFPVAAALASMMVLALVLAGALMLRGRGGPAAAPAVHEPVSVLIADFENRANDPVFDGSIEQALTIGVEGASFITTYARGNARTLAARLSGGGKLDEASAILISVRDGVKFVLTGFIQTDGAGYTISATLLDPAVGKTIKTETVRAKAKADVLQAVGDLAANVRRDLGDTTPESARLAASETFTANSLEAVREYTLAQDLANNSKDEEAIVHYKRAIDADAQFGRAYAGWANSSFQLGRTDEGTKLWDRALALMGRMTERERYRTMGGYFFLVARNYEKAVENYSTLVRLYPADRSGHNNLAVAYFNLLDFPKAREEGRRALEIYKGSFKFRNNQALYAMYAGDFDAAAKGARAIIGEDAKFADAYFPLAITQLAGGDRAGARQTYEQMRKTDASGASRAEMGLADLALYEGRFADAERILLAAIPKDEKDGNSLGLAAKRVALAEAYEGLGKTSQVVDEGRKAVAVMQHESVAVPIARVWSTHGRTADARAMAAELDKSLQPASRAYARIIVGEIALQENRVNDAVEAFRGAQRLFDVWLSHFDVGLAYVRAGHYAEALSELDICVKRRGEATAIFLDDMPSFRYLATLPYWLGRAQEGVQLKDAATESYKAYVALRRDAVRDQLADDARLRLVGR
jgi:tetratricopeptide (TPR) repeat protein/tRNA A-37 threonylcarbamoyl transferase component Bud32